MTERYPDQWLEASLVVRGSLRRALAKAGIPFTETKSLTASVFTLDTVPPEEYARICRELQAQRRVK